MIPRNRQTHHWPHGETQHQGHWMLRCFISNNKKSQSACTCVTRGWMHIQTVCSLVWVGLKLIPYLYGTNTERERSWEKEDNAADGDSMSSGGKDVQCPDKGKWLSVDNIQTDNEAINSCLFCPLLCGLWWFSCVYVKQYFIYFHIQYIQINMKWKDCG